MNADGESTHRFTVLDWLGVVVSGLSALGLLVFPVAARSFAAIFRDLGSADRLPAITRLAISGWFPVMLGLLVASGVVAGALGTLPLFARRAFVVVAFLLGGVGLGVCLVGLYLPIFSIAGAIKAD